jgi:predicted nucleic acid-binding protein
MAMYYLDTSALVKEYVAEVGHSWVRALCRPKAGNTLFVSQLTSIELEVALIRKASERTIAEADRDKSIALFRRHLRQRYTVVAITSGVCDGARSLVRLAGLPHPLRTYDAIHLASAQIIRAALSNQGAGILTFSAADRRLLAIAHHIGMPIDNPEDHP